MANIGERTFNGTTDLLDVVMGTMSGAASNPETWIFAGTLLNISSDSEIVHSGGYVPLDWYISGTGAKVQFFDGVADATDGPSTVPLLNNKCILVVTRSVGAPQRWAVATWNGTAWSAFSHTTSSRTSTGGSYATSGVIEFFNTNGLNASCALMARCNTALTTTEINTLTTNVAAWGSIASMTNRWRFDQTPVIDDKGTCSQNTLTGTTVSAGTFPLDGGAVSTTSVSASRSTTWNVIGRASSARASTWNVRSTVSASRATTWNVRSTVSASRATTWNVAAGTLTSVSASRSTTWKVLGRASSSRSATWNVVGRASSACSTTWNVAGSVSASRGTTWNVATSVSASRGTTWKVVGRASASRSTTWNVVGNYIFFDDFLGSSVDPNLWTVYNRLGDQVNNEVNAVIPANARVNSGTFKGDAKFETVTAGDTTTGAPNPRSVDYTSFQIAQTTQPFQYGTVEVRAKLPGGTGLWPCIWMLGREWQASQPFTANVAGADWPNNGWWEIDIAEFGLDHRTSTNTQLHFGSNHPGGFQNLPYDATSRFMVYRLEWAPTSLVWSVDPEDGSGYQTLYSTSGTAGSAIPNTPGYLIIHCAIGGTFATTPNSATFPQTMEVDYARISRTSNTTPTVSASRSTTWNVAAPPVSVSASRSTTWNVSKSVSASRSTTWNVAGRVSASRSSTWNVLSTVSASRSTTWNALVTASASRSTTWNVAGTVSSSRSTTWNVAGSITQVSASRSTTWNTVGQVSASRSTTWNALATASASRSTTWNALATASASRSTTWNVLSTVSASRSTTWNALATASASRSTTWNVAGTVSSSRSTTWAVLSQASSSRSATWNLLRVASASRAASWNVLTPVSASRSTTWNTVGQVSASRSTTWNVSSNSGVASVSASRSTTWNVVGRASSGRSTTWNVLTPVSASRSTTWNVTGRVSASRSATWNVAGSLTQVFASRSTTWNVAGAVSSSRSTTWNVAGAVSSSRSTTWNVAGRVSSGRSTTWNVAGLVSSGRSTTWNVNYTASASRSTTWNGRQLVSSARSTTWSVAPTSISGGMLVGAYHIVGVKLGTVSVQEIRLGAQQVYP